MDTKNRKAFWIDFQDIFYDIMLRILFLINCFQFLQVCWTKLALFSLLFSLRRYIIVQNMYIISHFSNLSLSSLGEQVKLHQFNPEVSYQVTNYIETGDTILRNLTSTSSLFSLDLQDIWCVRRKFHRENSANQVNCRISFSVSKISRVLMAKWVYDCFLCLTRQNA